MSQDATIERVLGAPTTLKWSSQQDAALKAANKWFREKPQQVFRLFGYAGTGKTTLAKHLAESIGDVVFAAYTGKAAHVMRSMGCPGASTIHSLIYKLDDPGDEKRPPRFVLNRESRAHYADLIIIDEVSMVDEEIGCDLLSFGVPVLTLGDPAQLPPVKGGGFFIAGEPDFMLTEIHRQARDNPIIAMATIVREGGRLEFGDYGASRVVTADKAGGIFPDQILVGRNYVRRDINRKMRNQHGITTALPVAGDKLVCLRNDHRIGLLNGSIWMVESVLDNCSDKMQLRIKPEDNGDAITVTTHAAFFDGSELSYWDRREFSEFDFGYALTVHKAQGSQWGSVALLDESACFRKDRARWLYTGITRAATQITVIR